jgi:methylglutaconyl-CoA hydratase
MEGSWMSELAQLTLAGPVATLALNRPDARNSLSLDLLAAAHARLGELEARGDISVLVFTGAGKAFCAGMDLKAVASDEGLAAGLPLRLLRSLAEFTVRLRALGMVTVAKVNGAAIGGGCGLATVCDLAVTHADSKMGFPEVDLGVCPAVVAPWLVRKIGAGRARQILLSGGLMSGQRALEVGIVDHVVPTLADLDPAVAAIVQRLATGGPAALRATKALLNQLDGSLNDALAAQGAELSARVLASPEAQAMLRSKLGPAEKPGPR